MELTGRAGVELRDLQRMHSLKTGALITASCLAGCILGGGGEKDMQNAMEYGKHLGMAFQIADDILDVVGDQQELGKPVGSDQDQGKNTYPSLVVWSRAGSWPCSAPCRPTRPCRATGARRWTF
jgi:geranylgeranyl diphosphate synthase type II